MFGPNITGKPGETLSFGPEPIGAFEHVIGNSQYSWARGSGTVGYPVLNASLSSAVYGLSAAVQPSAMALLPCIKL